MEFLVPILIVMVIVSIALNIVVLRKIKDLSNDYNSMVQTINSAYKNSVIETVMKMSWDEFRRIKDVYQEMNF
jgi:uncharacterized oligopeptide transporter (OPT) family protein